MKAGITNIAKFLKLIASERGKFCFCIVPTLHLISHSSVVSQYYGRLNEGRYRKYFSYVSRKISDERTFFNL